MPKEISVVIDTGSESVRAGFTGEDKPKVRILNVVERLETKNGQGEKEKKKNSLYIGRVDLEDNVGVSKKEFRVTNPVVNGVVQDWDDLERVWRHCFHKIYAGEKNESVILTELPGNSKRVREEFTEIFFESFEVGKFYLGLQPVFGLYATGRTTGVVVDLGHQVSYAVPVYEGYALPHLIKNIGIGGETLNLHFRTLLEKNNGILIENKTILEKLKHESCYVAEDFDLELGQSTVSQKYELPDGKKIEIGYERILCPEALFQPMLIARTTTNSSEANSSFEGIHITTRQLVKECIAEQIKSSDLYENISLIGGCSEFKGIGRRMEKEMEQVIPKGKKCNVVAPKGRRYAAWIGASLLGAMDSFDKLFLLKQEYDDNGPSVIHTKCKI
jgi:actin-related protein